jgi:hypothetical protein
VLFSLDLLPEVKIMDACAKKTQKKRPHDIDQNKYQIGSNLNFVAFTEKIHINL